MKKRIYGLETEYGIVIVESNGQWVCDPLSLKYYLDSFVNYLHGAFLQNGSRVYIDFATHPEYCTAECLSLRDMVAQDKAGEKILSAGFNKAVKNNELNDRILLFKNNTQYADENQQQTAIPVTFGCHENFSMDNRLGQDSLSPVFIPFLIVRQLASGSGWVTESFFQSQGIRYTLSQRAVFIRQVVGPATHNGWGRAILCTARFEEPLADASKYKRFHLLLGDSNMSELSTYLKVGSVGILLEMLEEDYPFNDSVRNLMPKNPVESLQLVCRDLTCKKPCIELDDGRFFSALDLFWSHVNMMVDYERRQGLNPELSDVLKRLIDILSRLERRVIDLETLMEINSQGLDEELDWLIKKSILERALQEFGCHWNNFFEKYISMEDRNVSVYDQIRAKDLKYHDISSDDGLYNIFSAGPPNLTVSEMSEFGIRTPRLVEVKEIESMIKNPPQNTRAKIRGDFIKFLNEKKIRSVYSVGSWDIISPISYTSASYPTITLPDPFATEDEKVEKIKKTLSAQC